MLGVDIPPTPEVILSSITDTEVTLFWKHADNYRSAIDSYIQLNGIKIGPLHRRDQAITLNRLEPGHHYSIRAISSNTVGNSAYSRFIQVQTAPSDGHKSFELLSAIDQDGTPGPPHAPSEISAKDTGCVDTPAPSITDDRNGDETLVSLKKRLDNLRRQSEEAAQQLAQETKDAESGRVALVKERDELKEAVEQKERESADLRKRVNDLEKLSKSSQRRKSAKERDLQRKRGERQRMRNEMAHWETETTELRSGADALRREKKELDDSHQQGMAELHHRMEDAQARSRAVDRQIQEWGQRIKELEEGHKRDFDASREEGQQTENLENEGDQQVKRIQDLEAQANELYTQYQQASTQSQRHMSRLTFSSIRTS